MPRQSLSVPRSPINSCRDRPFAGWKAAYVPGHQRTSWSAVQTASLFRLEHASTGLAALGHGVHEKNIGRQARPWVCLRSLLFRATITLHWAMRRKRLVPRPYFHIILPWFRFILSSVQFFDPQAYNQRTWRNSWVHSTTPIYLSLLRL